MRVEYHAVSQLPVQLLGASLHEVTGSQPVGTSQAPPVTPAPLPPVSRCSHKLCGWIMVFDESGSVSSHNDPSTALGRRHTEARLTLEHLPRCRCGNEFGVIRFFDSSPNDTPVLPLNKVGRYQLAAAVSAPPPATGSCLDDVLDDVEDIIEEHPDHAVSVIVFSDFQLFDPEPEATLTRLAGLSASVHAVVLHAATPQRLRDDSSVTVTRISWDSEPGLVAAAALPAVAAGRHVGS